MSKNSQTPKTIEKGIEERSRPVFAAGGEIGGSEEFALTTHQHEEGQLIFITKGMLTCEVAQGLYLLTPGSSLWIPPHVEHSVKGAGPLSAYCLFIGKNFTRRLPTGCCTMSVSSLLRELIFRCADISLSEKLSDAEIRLCRVLIDELSAAPLENMHLPMPTDLRLRRIAISLASGPAEKMTVEQWARRINVSERTLARLMLQQTGMTFGRWRQQLHISLSLQWLAEGRTVQNIATDLGYESASSFVAMFRKIMGAPPVKYLSTRIYLPSP